ncbi:nitrogen fixation protein NifQ [Thiobacillus sp.]|uniref:nitrogen fixation protein NifQ n=1 Tax=Thiobacillus sp. TaxID=924 RepID=UPI0025D7F8D3|nr:nitrogen fixation protein NifQ [Thiobacillus sp.]
MNRLHPCAVIRGTNAAASATALRLAAAGYAVLLADTAAFAVARRGPSCDGTLSDGSVTLDGVACRRVDSAADWLRYGAHDIALTAQALEQVLADLSPEVLVDARMTRHGVADSPRRLAPLRVELGPGFAAAGNAGLVVETTLDDPPENLSGHSPAREPVGAPQPARIAAAVVDALRRRLGLLPLARAAIAGVLRNAEAGELPLFAATLGFDRLEFNALVETLQPGARLSMPDLGEGYALCAVQEPELFDPLARMLWEQRAPDLSERRARWLAHAVAAASFGHRHLWQDLGLAGRAETTALLDLHFPALAARNTADLKWKRYLFLALGERLGLDDLQPPGCAGCDSHSSCYGAARPIPSGLPSGHRRPARPA